MAQIIVKPGVRDKLNSLVHILYNEEYFAFIENAKQYVVAIYEFIESIPYQRRKLCGNKKFGSWYCRYQANRNTSWYIGFDLEDDVYLIKFITNNHCEDYARFISGVN